MKISEIPAKLAKIPISQLRTVALIFVVVSLLMGLSVGDLARVIGYSLLGVYLWKSTRFHDLVLYISGISVLYGLASVFADANYFWGLFQIMGSLSLLLYANRLKPVITDTDSKSKKFQSKTTMETPVSLTSPLKKTLLIALVAPFLVILLIIMLAVFS